MDPATGIGVGVGLVVIFVAQIMEGGNPASLLLVPPMLLVFGATFFVSMAGGTLADFKAAIGGLVKATEGTGISKEHLESIRSEITAGTSALFLVTEQANLDPLGDRVRMHGTLLASNLTKEERDVLLETFGGA